VTSAPLLVATTNSDKIREIAAILEGLPYTLRTLDGHAAAHAPDETGATFAENARLKARHYAAVSGILTVAEDSGLEIDALDGAPGVHSARYGEPHAVTYPDKFALLYRALAARGLSESTARFTCALALARGDRILFETIGQVAGRIAPEPRGHGGFGYDPIFFYPPYGRTLAEVTRDQKARVSHRGQAFRKLRAFLESINI
jgi:XTP/dITP diphosphohydrolase